MRRQMTVAQYRAIDLTLFALILTVTETVIALAARLWFPGEIYTVSAVAAVTAIVMARWGPWAAIHAVLGGVVFCRASGAQPWQYAVYCAGNLLGLGGLFVIRALGGGEKLRADGLKCVAYAVSVLLMMQLGRAAVSLAFGVSLADAVGFFASDVLSLLFTALIVWIARRQDGLIENQKRYLLRVAQEFKREKENFDER